jgi:hypothetical protein
LYWYSFYNDSLFAMVRAMSYLFFGPCRERLLFLLLVCALLPVRGQETDQISLTTPIDQPVFLDQLSDRFLKAGFPDAAAIITGAQLQIVFTRSRFRPGAPSVLKLVKVIGTLPNDTIGSILITVNDRSIPLYSFAIPVVNRQPFPELSCFFISHLPEQPTSLQKTSARHANYSLVLSVDPQFRFAFGANPDPVQVQINIMPSLSAQLWRGSLLRFQYIIPLWNELDIPEEDWARPGLITFSQNLRFGKGFFTHLHVGYFTNYRYGAQLQVGKFLWKDRLFVGASLGNTGYASWPRRLNVEMPQPGWEVSEAGYLDYSLTAGWRWDRYHLQMLALYGRGLNDQNFISLAVARQFGQTTVEIFAQHLDKLSNYGVRLHVPIPFYRKFIGRRLAIQSGDFLGFRFNGTQNYLNSYQFDQFFPLIRDNLHPGIIFED